LEHADMSTEVSARKPPTSRQREWLAHLQAWREQGGSLKAYALAHGLSLSGLYGARRVLTQRGLWQPPRRREVLARPGAAKLVPVRVASMSAAVSMFRVLLPNGVVVEVPEQAEPARCRALLACLSEVLR
jgi:hypothetical protein